MAISRKWIRLSLRTLLLVTTVACFVLGHRAYVHQLQRDALQSILKLGGHIQGDAAQSSVMRFFVSRDHTIQARNVTSVAFLGPEFEDSDIGEFSRCALILPRLERVMMTDTMVTTDGERLLRNKLPNLEIKVINLIDQQKPTVTY